MNQPIDEFLADLGSAKSTPGGGAAAALMVATGAALIEMVTNLTIGKPRYAEHEPLMLRVRAQASEIRVQAQELVADDARAFDEVMVAYRLPADDPDRPAAISRTLAGAVRPPLRMAAMAATVIHMADEILPGANVNLLSDVSVAASAARAALEAAAVNVEINLEALRDPKMSESVEPELERHLAVARKADKIISRVRVSLRK